MPHSKFVETCYSSGMAAQHRAAVFTSLVLLLAPAYAAAAGDTISVTGPSFVDPLTGGPPSVPFPSASFNVTGTHAGTLFVASAPATGTNTFVSIASAAEACPGSSSVSSATPITLFACVDTTNLLRGNYANLITVNPFDSSIPAIRVPVQVTISQVGEIKTSPALTVDLSSTVLSQNVTVQFVSSNGASGGANMSACTDGKRANGTGSQSACIASVTSDPVAPPEGPWMTLTNGCSGVVLAGTTTCTIQVSADPNKLTNAVLGTTYVGHVMVLSTHGDRADFVVNFLYSQLSGSPLTITSANTFSGIAGQSFQANLTATGGTAPYTWSQTGLPATLSLNASTGVISGTPAAGTYPVSITLRDSIGTTVGPQTINIHVNSPQP